MTSSIARVAVVVPARDEELLLPACLDALRVAADAVRVPVDVVVALDTCGDGSAALVARRPWCTALPLAVANVGAARALGTQAALRIAPEVPAQRRWIATTDADSTVPPHWLVSQLALADAGWDLVVGTVRVDDWSAHSAQVAQRWAADYIATDHHPHVHGANLGVRASAYLAAGGWPALARHEDVALVEAIAAAGKVIRSGAHPVVTSARIDPRADGGFGDTLRALVG